MRTLPGTMQLTLVGRDRRARRSLADGEYSEQPFGVSTSPWIPPVVLRRGAPGGRALPQQSLVFLLIWVLICASASARPAGAPAAAPGGKPGEFLPALQLSTYEPTKTRNPFEKSPLAVAVVNTAPAPGAPVAMPPLHLDGILYSTVNPSASVNGQLLTLNKTVRLDPMGANIPVKAVAITRQQVTLEIMGQKVELKLNADKPPAGK